MADKYVWLLKGDNAYKSYKNKDWKTIISVRVENEDMYYCLSNTKQFINEDEKLKLIAPICVINTDYKDCIVTLNESPDLNFVWKNKRCISIPKSMSDDFIDSSLNYFNGNVIKVASAAQLAAENSIMIKSSSIYSVIFIGICFLMLIISGMYLWLF